MSGDCGHPTNWPHSAEGVGCLHDHPAAPAPVQGSDGLREGPLNDDWWTALFLATSDAVDRVPYAAASEYPVPHVDAYKTAAEPFLRRLLEAEAAVQRVRELHVPWYTIHGVRHDHTVMANCEDFDGCDGTADRDCDDAGEHERLACVECRHVFEDVDGNLFWPCPTARALGSQPTGGERTC